MFEELSETIPLRVKNFRKVVERFTSRKFLLLSGSSPAINTFLRFKSVGLKNIYVKVKQEFKMKKLLILLIGLSFFNANAQNKTTWNGKKCAVVLTYDDALNVHLDNAIPTLDSLNLKATFYLTASSQAGSGRITDWRKIAQNGHELGNHTLYHPCDATREGMSWVKPEYDLSKYSLRRIQDEIKMCNAYLKAIDGKDKRTFAFTCGHKKVIEGEFIQTLENEFVAARAVRHEMHAINEVKLMDIDCYGINGETGEQLIELVKQAQASENLLVFLFHGVGGEHSLNVSLPAHRQLLQYLKQNEKDIWVAPMVEVAEYIKSVKK